MGRVIGILVIVILVGIVYALFESIGTTMIGSAHMHANAMQRQKLNRQLYQPRVEQARMASALTQPPCEISVERAAQAQEYVLLEVRVRNPAKEPLSYGWHEFVLKDRDGMTCMPQQNLAGMPLPLLAEETPNLAQQMSQVLPGYDDARWFLGYRCPRAESTRFKLQYRGSVQDVYPTAYVPGRSLSAKVERVTRMGSRVCIEATIANNGSEADYFREEFFGLQDASGAPCEGPRGHFRLVRRGERVNVQTCFTCSHAAGGLGALTYVPAGDKVSLSIPEGERFMHQAQE